MISPHVCPVRRLRRILALALLALGAACTSSPYPEVPIDLASPRVQSRSAKAPTAPALRFSVAAMQSPRDTFVGYSRMFERLGARLGTEIEFVQRRTYREVNELLATGGLDAALVCTGGYLELERASPGAVEVVAVPVTGTGASSSYRSLVIVPATSAASAIDDLAGKRFAFTDELSLSGHAYVVRLLRRKGLEARRFFGTAIFTHSHDRSVEAVAKGLVDGAAVDSLVYERLVARSQELARATRVVHRSPTFGVAPVVVSSRLAPERRAELRDALLTLATDPAAAEAMREVGFEGFRAPVPGMYASAADVMRDVR